MNHNKLLNLFARNAKKGSFRAEGNVIYLYDVIVATDADAEWWGGVSAESFVQTLKGMTGDVELRINCPGGDVFGAKAMAQAIRDHDGTVTAHVDGYAASAATFLTSVSGRTLMAPGSMLMIHKAWTIALGNSADFTAIARLLDKIDGTIVETYAAAAAKRGVEDQDFAALMATETWFTPEEAIAVGLADEQEPADAKAKDKTDWDLSAYENAPAKTADIGTLKVKLEVDASAVREAIDAAIADITTVTEPANDQDKEIEAQRRQRVAAVRLKRPA